MQVSCFHQQTRYSSYKPLVVPEVSEPLMDLFFFLHCRCRKINQSDATWAESIPSLPQHLWPTITSALGWTSWVPSSFSFSNFSLCRSFFFLCKIYYFIDTSFFYLQYDTIFNGVKVIWLTDISLILFLRFFYFDKDCGFCFYENVV